MRLTRRSLLASLGGLGLVGLTARGQEARKRLVLVVSSGGWDPTFSVDPKPGTLTGGPHPDLDPDNPYDHEEVTSYGEIRVTLNDARRPQVRQFFDGWADHTVVVNGLWSGSLSHWTAMDRVLTGSESPDVPDFAVIAGVSAGEAPLATIDMAGLSRFGPLAPKCARAGVRAQLHALLDPSIRFDTPDGARPGWTPTEADHRAIRAFLDQRGGRPGGEALWAERIEALDRAGALRESARSIVETLPFGRRSNFHDQVPYAVELLANGTCNAVLLGTGYGWDTHGDASRQHGAWNGTFGGLGSLCNGLEVAGLFEDTLVVALSEIGRSPTRNAENGTGHWPYTSALVLGGGIEGRRVLGGTDDGLIGVGVDPATGRPASGADPLHYRSFAAGVLAALGIDPEPWLPGAAPLRGLVG